MPTPSSRFAGALLNWYDRVRRDLPWRVPPGATKRIDPYRVLVSEVMLQQTQVATVIPYFLRFIERFPTFSRLAEAPQREVLRFWQGLGYYSRARNLQLAAQRVMEFHGGELPRTVDALLTLPGIGLYTAGAIASIAFAQRVPAVDGNATRVLCRLDGIESDPRQSAIQSMLRRRAEQLMPVTRFGDFNSAMMELGATVCTPRKPDCPMCPVRRYCKAHSAGTQNRIPPPKPTKAAPLLRRDVLCIQRRDGKYLIEQRPPTGRWAGLWQFPTMKAGPASTLPARASAAIGLTSSCLIGLHRIGLIRHVLTHRRYEFRIHHGRMKGRVPRTDGRICVGLSELSHYPISRVHEKIAASL